jgi:hypothetical protein
VQAVCSVTASVRHRSLRASVLNPLSPSPPQSNSKKFVLGDVNVSLLRTARDRTIDVSRIHMTQPLGIGRA